MKTYCVGGIAFLLGTAAGFMIAQKLLKDRYEQLAQDEIDSVKDHFRKMRSDREENEPTTDSNTVNVTGQKKAAYRKLTESLKYTTAEDHRGEEADPELRPRIIPPGDFGMMDDYDEISLTYYADKTLCDERDHIMNDDQIAETVGTDSLSHFGEYEQDSVFVRNDRLKVDYEILMDSRTYDQVLLEKPWLMG